MARYLYARGRGARWRVDLEVVLLSARPDGLLGYRVVTGRLPRGASPDLLARRLAGLDDGPPPDGAVSHATSWRWTSGGRLVLTWTAVPDRCPQAAAPLTGPSIVCSADPLLPTPDGLHLHHVAAHGARHLAYLAGNDPTVGRAAAAAPALWDAVRAAASAPVDEHDRAHALATGWPATGAAGGPAGRSPGRARAAG